MRPIDADALKDKLQKDEERFDKEAEDAKDDPSYTEGYSDAMWSRANGIRDAIVEICDAPTIDIPHSDDWERYSERLWKKAYERGKADRPQGEWIDKGRNLWECSNCGMVIYSESEQDRNEFHKWCSRCGARMRGADDE